MKCFEAPGLALFAAITALASVSASPSTAPPSTAQDASIKVTYNKNFNPHPASSLLAMYKKHNVNVPRHLAAAASRPKKNGTVTTVKTSADRNDVQWLVTVDFGTPPQPLDLELDTGSNDLWVFGDKLPAKYIKDGPVYLPSKSSTSQKHANMTWGIRYGMQGGDGDYANGSVYSDTVAIGPFAAENLTFGIAEEVRLADDSRLRGIMGLGINNLSSAFQPQQVSPWLVNVRKSMKEPLFTANLNYHADGNYNFGFIDHTEHCGSITYTPVKDHFFVEWGFRSTGYAIGDGPMKPTFIPAIVDTGASMLLFYDEIVEDYYRNVKEAAYHAGEGGYIFPCDSTLPDFSFGLNNATTITVPGYFLNFRPTKVAGQCFGGIQNGTANGLWNVFGDVAIKAALVVFDYGNQRVGWAPKLLSPTPPGVDGTHMGQAHKKICYSTRGRSTTVSQGTSSAMFKNSSTPTSGSEKASPLSPIMPTSESSKHGDKRIDAKDTPLSSGTAITSHVKANSSNSVAQTTSSSFSSVPSASAVPDGKPIAEADILALLLALKETKFEIRDGFFVILNLSNLSELLQAIYRTVSLRLVQDLTKGHAEFYFEVCVPLENGRVVTRYQDQLFYGIAIRAAASGLISGQNVSTPALMAEPASASISAVASGSFELLCNNEGNYTVVKFEQKLIVQTAPASQHLAKLYGGTVIKCSGVGQCRQAKCQGEECRSNLVITAKAKVSEGKPVSNGKVIVGSHENGLATAEVSINITFARCEAQEQCHCIRICTEMGCHVQKSTRGRAQPAVSNHNATTLTAEAVARASVTSKTTKESNGSTRGTVSEQPSKGRAAPVRGCNKKSQREISRVYG